MAPTVHGGKHFGAEEGGADRDPRVVKLAIIRFGGVAHALIFEGLGVPEGEMGAVSGSGGGVEDQGGHLPTTWISSADGLQSGERRGGLDTAGKVPTSP
jgi:hypothetical protein